MQFFLRIVSVISFACVLASPASADLIIDIVGTPGSGQTSWTLRGSEAAGSTAAFESGPNLVESDGWVDVGNLFNSGLNSSNQIDIAITGPTVSIAGVNFAIDRLLLDDDGASNDEVGFGIDNLSNVSFNAGDSIAWSGSFNLSEDIGSMNIGSYVDPSPSFGGLALQVNISAVPEPGALSVFIFAAAAAAIRRRN